MTPGTMRVLFLGKAGDPDSAAALAFLQQHVQGRVTAWEGKRGETPPEDLLWLDEDYLISYICGWVVPRSLLARIKVAAINFHPASPEYPGTGCTNFALYEGATSYGVTCHHMRPRVDSGPIIAMRRFPLLPADTIVSVTQRGHAHLLSLFYDIASLLVQGQPLPVSEEVWRPPARTRAELNALCVVTPDMPTDEIARRVRATRYPGAQGAYLELAGTRFFAE